MATTVSVREKSKKPTGLGVERTGTKLKCTWTIGDKDYNFGEYFDWRVKDNNIWEDRGITHWKKGGKTSKTINLNTYYYIADSDVDPINSSGAGFDYVYQAFEFRVRGCRDGYTTSKGKGKNKVTTLHGTYYSDWAEKEFKFYAPYAPDVSEKLDKTDQTTFSWSYDDSSNRGRESQHHWYSKIHWQTILRANESESAGPGIAHLFRAGTLGFQEAATTNRSGSKTIEETTASLPGWLDGTSYTRWFRVRAVGPAGSSGWVYTKHVYAKPRQVSLWNYGASKTSGGMDVSVKWQGYATVAQPVDKDVVQYLIGTPSWNGSDLVAPTSGWTDAPGGEYNHSNDGDAHGFKVGSLPKEDECLWVRVNTWHDQQVNEGNAARIATVDGALKTPENLKVTVGSGRKVTVSAQNKSSVEGSFIAIRFTSETTYPTGRIIGIIPTGQSQVTNLTYPEVPTGEAICFAVKAVVGKSHGPAGNLTLNEWMSSPWNDDGGKVPIAPAFVTLEPTDIQGSVRVTWDWSWAEATQAELSWADHEDAWNSTSAPSTFLVSSIYESSWNISGLETGKKWFIRVRLVSGFGDNVVYGPYSDLTPTNGTIDLATVPSTPFPQLSSEVVTKDGSFTVAWGYASADGTLQTSAEVSEVVDGEYVPIARALTVQHALVEVSTLDGWDTGSTHKIAVKVTSGAGLNSDWSLPVEITVADPIEVSMPLSATSLKVHHESLVDDGVEFERTYNALTALPLEVTATGAGPSGSTTIAIVRAENYPIMRPTAEEWNGVEGEVVAVKTREGEGQIKITNNDLIGRLDDGAKYKIVATIQDNVGQISETELPFEVEWDIQAVVPDAEVTIDDDEMIAIFKPIAPKRTPADVLAGATCDVYRLSSDRPELIYENATFGVEYVDPYPTFGDFGGYRFVFKTINGDYITADRHMAITDVETLVDTLYNVIDFGQDRAELIWNVDLSSTWKKDFKETQYLGGSVQGDWNPAVERTGSVNGVVIKAEDQNTIEAMRRLAEHTGHCHVRTQDGSSYTADVQVSENRGHEPSDLTVDFSLSITRIDPIKLDAMTYAEWKIMQQEV